MLAFSPQQIAKKLNVNIKTISRDFQFLKKDSSLWLNNLPQGEIQLQIKKNHMIINSVIQELWKIYGETEDKDKKIKLLDLISNKSKIQLEMMDGNHLLKIRSMLEQELSPHSSFRRSLVDGDIQMMISNLTK